MKIIFKFFLIIAICVIAELCCSTPKGTFIFSSKAELMQALKKNKIIVTHFTIHHTTDGNETEEDIRQGLTTGRLMTQEEAQASGTRIVTVDELREILGVSREPQIAPELEHLQRGLTRVQQSKERKTMQRRHLISDVLCGAVLGGILCYGWKRYFSSVISTETMVQGGVIGGGFGGYAFNWLRGFWGPVSAASGRV